MIYEIVTLDKHGIRSVKVWANSHEHAKQLSVSVRPCPSVQPITNNQ
jgi:hypothetical protein